MVLGTGIVAEALNHGRLDALSLNLEVSRGRCLHCMEEQCWEEGNMSPLVAQFGRLALSLQGFQSCFFSCEAMGDALEEGPGEGIAQVIKDGVISECGSQSTHQGSQNHHRFQGVLPECQEAEETQHSATDLELLVLQLLAARPPQKSPGSIPSSHEEQPPFIGLPTDGPLCSSLCPGESQDHRSGSRGLKALHRGERREAEGEGQGSAAREPGQ
mmetsp:Transcript_10472/g.22252  ORF Transcript_10472/g.22252 Transcript_10472/m.22252 type:complete len:215 (-) Transcript_10472:375-1019(-)